MYSINIDKNDLPYKFELVIKQVLYDFAISYNTKYDFFSVTLLKDEVVLIQDEKIVLNQRLFNNIEDAPEAIMGIFGINEDVTELTFENLNFKTVFAFMET